MNFLDVIVLIPAAWFAFRGFTKGLIMELFSLGALVLGMYCCLNFSDYIGSKFTINSEYAEVITFVLTFLAVVVLVFLLGKLIERIIDAAQAGFANHLLGAVFGILKIAVIFSALFYVIHTFDHKQLFLKSHIKENSLFFFPLEKMAEKAMESKSTDN